MIRVENFEQAPLSHRYYGGNGGKKVVIRWNGDNWLLKFSTADHARKVFRVPPRLLPLNLKVILSA